jgi:hypothetical protein
VIAQNLNECVVFKHAPLSKYDCRDMSSEDWTVGSWWKTVPSGISHRFGSHGAHQPCFSRMLCCKSMDCTNTREASLNISGFSSPTSPTCKHPLCCNLTENATVSSNASGYLCKMGSLTSGHCTTDDRYMTFCRATVHPHSQLGIEKKMIQDIIFHTLAACKVLQQGQTCI